MTPGGPTPNGDEDTLVTFLEQRWDELYWFIRRRMGDHHTAEDIRQKTALGFVMRSRKRGPMDESERGGLLYCIAVNKMVDERREKARRPAIPTMQNQLELHSDLTAEDEVMAVLDRMDLAWTLSCLTPPQRLAIELTCFDGLDQQTAAGVMGISKSGLRQHRDAAKKKLFRYLTESRSGEQSE